MKFIDGLERTDEMVYVKTIAGERCSIETADRSGNASGLFERSKLCEPISHRVGKKSGLVGRKSADIEPCVSHRTAGKSSHQNECTELIVANVAARKDIEDRWNRDRRIQRYVLGGKGFTDNGLLAIFCAETER